MVPNMESKVDYIFGDKLPVPLEPIEVAEGILWFRLPMPIALDHINIYLLDDGDSWVLIDTGLADTKSIEIWTNILKKYLSKRPIQKIIGTHFHPDHVGLAGWLIERTDAEFWMTQIEWLSARQAYLTVDSGASQAMSTFYQKANLKPDLIKIYDDIGNDYRSMVTPIPLEYDRIEHSTLFKIGDRIWKPVFGSGHSPDHVSFYCEKDRIMLGGDMLLPRITPIIAVWWQEPNADPLEGYIEFLKTLGYIGSDALILPAHNRPYKELQTRVADLISHHNERLEITYEACKNENSAEAIMQELFIRKLDPFQTRFAIGETIAHINNLIKKGTLRRRLDDDGVYFYSQN
jgi:glyoxylase-like metal-dependent hydrolase (beta-lactamase superfamily II)